MNHTLLSATWRRRLRAPSRTLMMFGICCIVAIAPHALAQSVDGEWRTVDNILDGGISATSADSRGAVYMAGSARIANADGTSSYFPLITRTIDGGTTWSDLALPTNITRAINAVSCVDISGAPGSRVLIAGTTVNGLTVQYSDNSGENWASLGGEILKPQSYYSLSVTALTARNDGTAFLFSNGTIRTETVTRKGITVSDEYHMIAHRLAPGAQTWQKVFDQVVPKPGARSAVCVGTNLFVTGGDDGFFNILRCDINGNWTVAFRSQLEAGTSSAAMGLSADATGGLIACGRGAKSLRGRDKISCWWVFTGSGLPGGTWKTVCEIPQEGAAPVSVAQRNGSIFVCGSAVGGMAGDPSLRRWYVYRGDVSGGTWTWSQSDLFYLNPSSWAEPRDAAVDAYGNIFACGAAPGMDGVSQSWIVRRRQATLP